MKTYQWQKDTKKIAYNLMRPSYFVEVDLFGESVEGEFSHNLTLDETIEKFRLKHEGKLLNMRIYEIEYDNKKTLVREGY